MRLDRHAWNVRLDEELYIGAAIRRINAKKLFEIGTFNGGTTLCMAENAGCEAHTFTLDLPSDQFDREQGPDNFTGSMVGQVFHGKQVEKQITQLRGDSTLFDYSPYEKSIDFVFVDAAHDYIHGLADSKSALRLVRPGGVIFWHDYEPYWSGLIHGVREATAGMPLARIRGTTLAVLRT